LTVIIIVIITIRRHHWKWFHLLQHMLPLRGLSVSHTHAASCWSRWTEWDAIWQGHSCGPK